MPTISKNEYEEHKKLCYDTPTIDIEPEILNSFDCVFTNGFTEGCNNKIKVIKRVSFGVRNFDYFRNRILHCASLT